MRNDVGEAAARRRRALAACWLTVGIVVNGMPTPLAQGRPRAAVTVVHDADSVRAGSSARLALGVSLPPGVHVQSDQPRDPFLIATSVTPTPPPGVRVVAIVYPASTDFSQTGGAAPLAVFEQRFTIGIKLAVDAGTPPGDVSVPIRFRYQACDERTCFPPLREELTTVLHVVPPSATPKPQAAEIFDTLKFTR